MPRYGVRIVFEEDHFGSLEMIVVRTCIKVVGVMSTLYAGRTVWRGGIPQ